jgi:hypothetical protein
MFVGLVEFDRKRRSKTDQEGHGYFIAIPRAMRN